MKKDKIFRNPYFRISIVIITLAVLITAIVFLAFISHKALFITNRHFMLRNVIVKSSGYWNEKGFRIINILNLKKGRDNIFELNLRNLKKELLEHREYSIENVDIYKELPDSLIFNITERIPRALLYNRNSALIVDGKAVLINKEYCVNINSELPIITGFKIDGINAAQSLGKNKIPYGKILNQLKPALALISLINTEYSEFNLKLINLYKENELIAFMPDPLNKKIISVNFPFKYSGNAPYASSEYKNGVNLLKVKLDELKKLYRYLRINRKTCSKISLLYENQAIVK